MDRFGGVPGGRAPVVASPPLPLDPAAVRQFRESFQFHPGLESH